MYLLPLSEYSPVLLFIYIPPHQRNNSPNRSTGTWARARYLLLFSSLGFFFVLFGLWSRLSTTFHLFDIALVCINETRLSVELGFGVVLFLT